jgi:hypothetical protein
LATKPLCRSMADFAVQMPELSRWYVQQTPVLRQTRASCFLLMMWTAWGRCPATSFGCFNMQRDQEGPFVMPWAALLASWRSLGALRRPRKGAPCQCRALEAASIHPRRVHW